MLKLLLIEECISERLILSSSLQGSRKQVQLSTTSSDSEDPKVQAYWNNGVKTPAANPVYMQDKKELQSVIATTVRFSSDSISHHAGSV